MPISLLIQARQLFSLQKAILWMEDSYFKQKQQFQVKKFLIMDLFLTNTKLFTSQDINCWTGEVWITCRLFPCFYQLFWLILTAPIHFRASTGEQVMECYISPYLVKKNSYILDWLRVSTLSAHFHFWVKYSFKTKNPFKYESVNTAK